MKPADVQRIIDNKTKPLGALGGLECLAKQICLAQRTERPSLQNPHIIVFAADHGLALEGVSAYPQEVTAQMVLNFAQGGAAVNVFSRQHQITLDVVDAGVNADFPKELQINHKKVAKGTKSSLQGDALTDSQLNTCAKLARELVDERAANGCNIIGFGEMGIGNTSSASLILHFLSELPIDQCVGRGTGLSDDGLDQKRQTLERVAIKHKDLDRSKAEEIMKAVGGFEIVCITYAMLAAAERNMLILVDGFIASAAAMLACKINESTRQNMIFCHKSEEHAHSQMLALMEAEPILDLNMRLGEGSACALAFPLVESAVRFINEMASFESAAVSKKTEG